MKSLFSERSRDGARHLVVSVAELDRAVFEELQALGAAKPSPDDEGSYIVTDTKVAHSREIMPRIFDSLGRQGWVLVAVNKMECFIFERSARKQVVRYKVMTAADMDRAALKVLEMEGKLSVEADETDGQVVQIDDPQAARIQTVLPKVLGELADYGWSLAAISGPQLYIFVNTSATDRDVLAKGKKDKQK